MPGEDDIDFAIRRHAEQQNTKSESIESVIPADRSDSHGLPHHRRRNADLILHNFCYIFKSASAVVVVVVVVKLRLA